MPTVIFTDGTLLSADTWSALEQAWRERQWTHDHSKAKFRLELANRAYVWSETDIERPVSSKHLFEQLQDAGILRIVEEEQA